jgi:ribosomal protein S18 acetylase RimI-like enzyme
MPDQNPTVIYRVHEAERHLVTALFDAYRVFYQQPSDIDRADAFLQERLESGESIIYVALQDGKPVGFTQLYPTWSSVRTNKNWILNDLYVSPDHRKQGIGEALIRQAMAFAKEHGSTWVQLETAQDNHTAQGLYESMGFKKIDIAEGCFFYRIPV